MPSHPGSFRLDSVDQCLVSDEQRISLTRKTFGLLRYFVEHRNLLVTKEALLKAVWPGVHVEEGQVRQSVAELRKLLDDDPDAPRFIQTVHGRGYRLIGDIALANGANAANGFEVAPVRTMSRTAGWSPEVSLLGRDDELAQLLEQLEQARRGERQACFVTGESGIGKTTLASAFVKRIAAQESLWIVHGQCVEQYGTTEPCFPILSGLEALCDAPEGDRVVGLLQRYAPSWLLEMPGRLNPEELEGLRRATQATNHASRLRAGAHFFEMLAAERGVVLWLEDLHWADETTLNLVSHLARSPRPAFLLVLATCRSHEMYPENFSLQTLASEVRLRRLGRELPLLPLSEHLTTRYLDLRWPGAPPGLASLIHRSSEGNPMFVVTLVDQLIADTHSSATNVDVNGSRAVMVHDVLVPERLRGIIERQFENLDPQEQQLLETASVAGCVFSAAVLVPALGVGVESIERRCAALARRKQFIRARGMCEWPDGTLANQFEFLHTVSHQTLYERAAVNTRARVHQIVGECLEAAYRERSGEIASQLAHHFECARDRGRAARYLTTAGENALQRHGYAEAANGLSKALAMLMSTPESIDRDRQELRVHLGIATALRCIAGVADPQIERSYRLALALCDRLGDLSRSVVVQWGLLFYHFLRAELHPAREIGTQLLVQCERAGNRAALVAAHLGVASASFHLGEFALCAQHAAQGLEAYDPEMQRSVVVLSAPDQGVQCRIYNSLTQWILGHGDEALAQMQQAQSMAEATDHPYTIALALCYAAKLHQFRNESESTLHLARTAMTFAQEHALPLPEAAGEILHGWALGMLGQHQDGVAQIQQGLDIFAARGVRIGRPWHLFLLADVYRVSGCLREAVTLVDDALILISGTGDCVAEGELYRLRGELLFGMGGANALEEVETCMRQSLDLARRRGARSWEVRTANSLAGLWNDHGTRSNASGLLPRIKGSILGFK